VESQTLELEHMYAYSFEASLSSACRSAYWDSSSAVAAAAGTAATAVVVVKHLVRSVDLPLVDATVSQC